MFSSLWNDTHIMENTPVRSVRKALDLMDWVIALDLAGRPGSLAELAEHMGMRPNSAWNLLKTLTDCGYLAQRGRGLYGVGPKLRQLGQMNQFDAPPVRRRVRENLDEFARREGEGIVLTILVAGARVVVARVDPSRAVTVSEAVIEAGGFWTRPTGRMLAAAAELDGLERILQRSGLPGGDWDGIHSRAGLDRALSALRGDGHCVTDRAGDELFAAACPLPGVPESPPAVLGVYAPLYRCDRQRQTHLLTQLKQTADALGQDLAGVLPTT